MVDEKRLLVVAEAVPVLAAAPAAIVDEIGDSDSAAHTEVDADFSRRLTVGRSSLVRASCVGR